MNGSSVLEGYTPEIDATVVTRILDAGGTILGKAVCEHFCSSGGSHTSDTGPVRNPQDQSGMAGGSSSGSAELVAASKVNMAIGGDQGGSIQMPSCCCGIFRIKPTYGLVSYTGVAPIELTIDHAGPMARTVADVALLLEMIAEPDGLDPRHQAGLQGEAYTQALTGKIDGPSLGFVPEGLGWEGLSEVDVDGSVEQAAHAFEKPGAQIKTVSIPWHRNGRHILFAIFQEGATMLMAQGYGMGTNRKGHYTTSLIDAMASGLLTGPDDLSETVKLTMLACQYLQERYHGLYYAQAQNLSGSSSAAYHAALQECDLLFMKTPYR